MSVGGKMLMQVFLLCPALHGEIFSFFGFINTVQTPPWTCVFPVSTRFENMFNYHSKPLGLHYDISYLFLAK